MCMYSIFMMCWWSLGQSDGIFVQINHMAFVIFVRINYDVLVIHLSSPILNGSSLFFRFDLIPFVRRLGWKQCWYRTRSCVSIVSSIYRRWCRWITLDHACHAIRSTPIFDGSPLVQGSFPSISHTGEKSHKCIQGWYKCSVHLGRIFFRNHMKNLIRSCLPANSIHDHVRLFRLLLSCPAVISLSIAGRASQNLGQAWSFRLIASHLF